MIVHSTVTPDLHRRYTHDPRHEPEGLFSLLVHSVKDYAIFLLDPTGVVISWNDGAQRIKGYSENEILGHHFSRFYAPEAVAAGHPANELRVAEAEGRVEDEGWRVRKDGSRFWANVVITALRGPEGELKAFAKVTRDLTEHRNAEEALRQSEERSRLLIESVEDYAIFMLDTEGRILTWNAGAERIKGYPAREVIGQHFSKFYPPEAAKEGWPEKQLALARTAGRFEDEGWRMRKDGSRFWADVVITALHGSDGRLTGFSKITRDMTERRKWEEHRRALNIELQAKMDQLAETNRNLNLQTEENEAFVYSVSHDIRSPLVNLQGFGREVELAVDELRPLLADERIPAELRSRTISVVDTGIRDSIQFIQTAVVHLSRIVDGLLRLSRAGRVVYQLTEVSMVQTVHRILESMTATIEHSGAQVTVGELPPVWGDATAMEQLFSNLISNAIRYLDPSRPGKIHIDVLPGSARMRRFFVRDNGLGIPESAQPKLFSVFQRFHPKIPGGEGMGLAIVRRIVERHNGRIRVDSLPGQGTTFYVELPTRMG